MGLMPENVRPPCGNGLPLPISKPSLIGKLLLFIRATSGPDIPSLCAKESFKLPSFCYEGPPLFDDKGFYLGPLPMAKGMGSIRNRQSQGPFKTSATEMWPAKMCQWISSMLLSPWASSATTASKGVPDTQSREENETLARQKSWRTPSRYAKRRVLESWVALGRREFTTCQEVRETSMTDGDCAGGLPIGEIWRIVTAGRNKLFGKAARRAGGVDELEREIFRMAAGGEDGCRLVRDQRFIKELVDTMGSWIEARPSLA